MTQCYRCGGLFDNENAAQVGIWDCQVCNRPVCENCADSHVELIDPSDGAIIHSCDLHFCKTPECREGAKKL